MRTQQQLTREEAKTLETQVRAYSAQMQREATWLVPYRPYILAATLLLEGHTLDKIRQSIENEGWDWPQTLEYLTPILPALQRLSIYQQAGWLICLDDL